MKVFFTRKTIIILFAAIAIAAITLVSVNTAGNPGLMTNIGSVVSKPLKGVAAYVADTFEKIYGNIYKYENIVAENELYKEQIQKLQADYREYTLISEELDRIRALLGFAERHESYQYEEAIIIQPGGTNWSSRFTINRGSTNSQIEVGNCIITETGVLVGRIISVEPTTSTAISILDTTFSAAVEIGDDGGVATAVGDFALMRQGLLKLDYIQQDAIAVSGDTIITSGKSGYLPSGLILGTIDELYDYSSGIDRYATVRPAVDIDTVSSVYVIYSFEITE